MDKLEKWRGYIPDAELETYRKGGFAQRIGMGDRVALLNIDTTYMFVDPSYSMCGRDMSDVTDAIIRLTSLFRRLDLPIYYSRRDDRSHPTYRGVWNYKLAEPDAFQYARDPRADQWPEPYAPRPIDRIILKNKPSCFSRRLWSRSFDTTASILWWFAAFRPQAACARAPPTRFRTTSAPSSWKKPAAIEARRRIGPTCSTSI